MRRMDHWLTDKNGRKKAPRHSPDMPSARRPPEARGRARRAYPPSLAGGQRISSPRQPDRQAIEIEVNHRRREERQDLAHDEAADDGDAERMTEFRAGAGPEHQRQRGEDRGESRHQDRAKAQ